MDISRSLKFDLLTAESMACCTMAMRLALSNCAAMMRTASWLATSSFLLSMIRVILHDFIHLRRKNFTAYGFTDRGIVREPFIGAPLLGAANSWFANWKIFRVMIYCLYLILV